jgi:hypothetical protein
MPSGAGFDLPSSTQLSTYDRLYVLRPFPGIALFYGQFEALQINSRTLHSRTVQYRAVLPVSGHGIEPSELDDRNLCSLGANDILTGEVILP